MDRDKPQVGGSEPKARAPSAKKMADMMAETHAFSSKSRLFNFNYLSKANILLWHY
jgi:hypothetical protein